MGTTWNMRDAALGAATVALLMYAAVTMSNFSGALREPAQVRAGCPSAGAACRNDALQLARSRDP